MRPLALFMLAVPAGANALVFDFTTLGANNTLLPASVTVSGVTAYGYANNFTTPATLWLRNEPNDHGLGVCTETNCATGGGDVNELDNNGAQEMIVLERPAGHQWTSLWVSSHDGGGSGGSEEGLIVWGDTFADLGTPTAANSYAFAFPAFGGSLVEGDLFTIAAFLALFDVNARYVLFRHPDNAGDNNDYLVWKGALEPSELDVPEPGTLALVGLGTMALALRRRRH